MADLLAWSPARAFLCQAECLPESDIWFLEVEILWTLFGCLVYAEAAAGVVIHQLEMFRTVV